MWESGVWGLDLRLSRSRPGASLPQVLDGSGALASFELGRVPQADTAASLHIDSSQIQEMAAQEC